MTAIIQTPERIAPCEQDSQSLVELQSNLDGLDVQVLNLLPEISNSIRFRENDALWFKLPGLVKTAQAYNLNPDTIGKIWNTIHGRRIHEQAVIGLIAKSENNKSAGIDHTLPEIDLNLLFTLGERQQVIDCITDKIIQGETVLQDEMDHAIRLNQVTDYAIENRINPELARSIIGELLQSDRIRQDQMIAAHNALQYLNP